MDNKFVKLLKSRKFWAAAVGLVVVVANNTRAEGPVLDEATVLNFVVVVVGYIIGTAVEDANRTVTR